MDISVTSSSSPQRDSFTLVQATFLAATIRSCLPFLWLLPQLLLKTLQPWGARASAFCCPQEIPAINSKMLQSGGNNPAHVIGDISYKSSQPVRNPNAQEGCTSAAERLKLAEYTLTRQICFFRVTLHKANILAH